MTVATRGAAAPSLRLSAVVARFTLLGILRRRWLLFAGGLGLVLLVVDGVYSIGNDHVVPDSYEALVPHRLAYQVFASSASLTAVIIGGITMVVAMSIIRDDLGSGAAELLLTKPLPRASYALGKIATLALTVGAAAAVVILVRVAVLAAVINDSAYLADSVLDTLAIAADAFVLGVVVLAISSWGSSLAAALVAVIMLLVATISAPMMPDVAAHRIADQEATLVTVAYDMTPRMLSGPRDNFTVGFRSSCDSPSIAPPGCPPVAMPVHQTTAGSSAVDVVAWAAYALGMAGIMLLGIRRFSGRLVE